MNKKKQARFEALKGMAKSKFADKSFGSKVEEKLKAKRLSKVTVMAEDEEGLKKGLSKAQQILKAKLGEKFGLEDDEEEEEEHDEECPGCEVCEEESEDEEEDEE